MIEKYKAWLKNLKKGDVVEVSQYVGGKLTFTETTVDRVTDAFLWCFDEAKRFSRKSGQESPGKYGGMTLCRKDGNYNATTEA